MTTSEIHLSSDLTHDCEPKNDSLKPATTLDKLMMNVTPKLVSQTGDNEEGEDRGGSTTYVTIHLPDGMQGSTLSQQKLQELILHLSQSGQIQLREDSKIVIDLKFTGKGSTQTSVTKLEAPNFQAHSLSNSVSSVSSSVTASPRIVHLGNLNCGTPFKIELPSSDNIQVVRTVSSLVSSPNHVITIPNVVTQPTASQHLQSRQVQQQQQPTYILVPATQLASGGENQVYSNTQQVRPASTCPTIMRTPGLALSGNTISNSNSITFGSNDRSFILVQQPLTGSSVPIGSHNSIVTGSNTTSGTIVPLRHLTGGNAASSLVSGGTTLMTGSSNRLSASGVELFTNTNSVGSRASQNTPSSVGLVAITGAGSGISSNSNQRESTWQQYVKQFTKLGPCPICGDKISGYHYGIFCCESCKGFFKRTVQNAKRYACHRPNASSLCDINVASRKKCPACRFIKCVDKGMRIEDDPEQLSCSVVGLAGAHHTLGPDGLPATDDAGGGVYLDPGVLGTHDNDDEDEDADGNSMRVEQSILDYGIIDGTEVSSTPFMRKQVVSGSADPSTRTREQLPKIIRDILLVEETIEAEPEDSLEIETGIVPPGAVIPEGVSEDEAAVYRALLNLADQRLYRTVRWSRALPDFAQLDTDDQILLIQNCWADLLCLDCCWRSLPTPTEIRLTSSKCINLEAAREMGAEEIVERMLQLTQSLTRLHLDVIEYACLKVIVLMQPDLKNLKAAKQVKEYQDSVNRLLLDYVLKSSPDVKDKYSKLLQRIPELRKTSQAARLMLVDLDLSAYLSTNSLLMELLRSDIQRFAPSHSGTTAITPGANTTSTSTSVMTKTVSITMATDSNHDGEIDPNNQDNKLSNADSYMESDELVSLSHLSNTANDEGESNEAGVTLSNIDMDNTHNNTVIASSE